MVDIEQANEHVIDATLASTFPLAYPHRVAGSAGVAVDEVHGARVGRRGADAVDLPSLGPTYCHGSSGPGDVFWNFFEAMLVFLRDEVARPAIGRHDADRFLPFIWTIFFFVLFCNLLGLVPWAGSPTGRRQACTGALALMTFGVVVGSGIRKFGPVNFWTGLVPHMELPKVLADAADSDDLLHRSSWDWPSSMGSWPFVSWRTCLPATWWWR